MAPPALLTIFVRCHQLVDLLVGPRSQDLNEALLIGTNALGEGKGHVSQGLGWEATSPEMGTWGGQSKETRSTQGAPNTALRHQAGAAALRWGSSATSA